MTGLGGSQFRESAAVRNANPEPLDDRAQLTAPREWAVLACLGLALAAVAVWGALGSVERTLRLDGVLVLAGERHTMRSAASGTVGQVSVQAGERVAAGQPIARIAPERLEQPVRFAAASMRLLEDETKSATTAARDAAERLLASARTVLEELTKLTEEVTVESPGDGMIAAMLVVSGETVRVGAPIAELVSGDAGRLDSIAFVSKEESWLLAPGMAARVSVNSPHGVQWLPAEITAVGRRTANPPGWLARMRPSAMTQGQGHIISLAISDPTRLAFLLDGSPGIVLGDGTACRIEIVLERTSPFGLLWR